MTASRSGGLEKQGRIERVKERKGRGKGREVNKVSCSSPSRGTLDSCPCPEETRDQRVPVADAGSGPLAGKLARAPRVVRMSVSAKKSPCQSHHLL